MEENQVKIKKESSSTGVTKGSDGSYYPYGTSLGLEGDIIDELELSKLAVGDVVEIKGYAFVESKSEYSNKESVNKSIRLQFTSMEVEREEDDRVKQMYGD